MKYLIALLLALPLAAQTTTFKATVAWDDALNPAGVVYDLERALGGCAGTPAFASIATDLTAKTYVNQPLQPGKYCYRVTAKVNGALSTGNPTAEGTVPAFTPSNLRITIEMVITP